MKVFWEHGFDGTSLTDLTTAMGIERPSLYSAFGNKESLFRLALNRYEERADALLATAEKEATARAFTQRLLGDIAETFTKRSGPTGCFFLQGALSSSQASEPIRKEVARRRLIMQSALRKRFMKSPNELPPGTSPADLAAYFATVIHGLAVRASDGATRHDLRLAIALSLRSWSV